jgi:hypothetical protein
MTQTQGAFTDRLGSSSIGGGGYPDTQSEIIKPMNTMQDFFQIEQENERMQQELYEIQSSFTN